MHDVVRLRQYNEVKCDTVQLLSNARLLFGMINTLSDASDRGVHPQFRRFASIYPEILQIVRDECNTLQSELNRHRDEDFDEDGLLQAFLREISHGLMESEGTKDYVSSQSGRVLEGGLEGHEAEEATHSTEVRAERLGQHLDLLEGLFAPFHKENEFNPSIDSKFCSLFMSAVGQVLVFLERERLGIVSAGGADSVDAVDAHRRISLLNQWWEDLSQRFIDLDAALPSSSGEED